LITKNISYFLLIFIVILFSGCNINQTSSSTNSLSQINSTQEEIITPADKIEVVHFHTTHQCWSCISVGKYALQTIKGKFAEEYKNGKIVFKEINIDLPENSEIVKKYQVTGSSLFINSIIGEKDNIKEDVDVWRYVSDENQFISYFQNKLNKLLGR